MSVTVAEQSCYTLINAPVDSDMPSEIQLKEKFEKGETKAKVDALKKLIFMILNGEKVSQSLMMCVIRFCLPTQDHLLKKLLLMFFEIVPKTSSDGKLLHEMILVCDAYRKDLQHPNEFIRGSTLRFLCKLKEPELIEPLMPAIRTCLEHRHSYVRRNAVLAIFTIYRNFEFLIPDGPELIYNFLETEQDASCKRNAFMMLLQADQERALEYLSGCIDQVTSFGDILQLIIVELIYKVCHARPAEKSRFIRCVYNLLQSQSGAVRYEAAGTLITLSAAPTAIKAAAQAYIDLVIKESDNNIKLIVLDRLINLRGNPISDRVLQELVMDILRVLSAPDIEVRRKTLHLALDLVSSRNVQEMVMFLRKEIGKSNDSGQEESTGKYRQLLVRTLHSAAIKFPDVAANIFPVLMEFLSDDSETAAQDVLLFVREAVQRLDHLRPVVLTQLMDVFGSIRNAKVYRAALWILGEYCDTNESIQEVMTLIRQSLGELPIVDDEMRIASGEQDGHGSEGDFEMKAQVKQLVTADGTYATQSALMNGCSVPVPGSVITGSGTLTGRVQSGTRGGGARDDDRPALRRFLLNGEFFVAAALATSLTKLALRYEQLLANSGGDKRRANGFSAEAMFILASIIHLGKSGLSKTPITEDDLDRLSVTIKLLAEKWPDATEIFLSQCRSSLDVMLRAKQVDEQPDAAQGKDVAVQADRTIGFTQLSTGPLSGATAGGLITENLFDASLSQALGTSSQQRGAHQQKFDFATSKLGKVIQLAGFSDPVYAEAYVNVNQYDIVMDVLVVNQTSDTLQNLSLELATLGDLKLVEKPGPITLAPHDFANIKANVKVASTENGVIFSTIAYDIRGSTSDRNCVYLDDVHIDIMDYIVPGECTDNEFRQVWAECEWENKVAVNTPITELRDFLDHLTRVTNMKLLTPDAALEGDCRFMAANFYAHSIFGEDALANVSIEKTDPADPLSVVTGHIRIRAKSQGMALALGDKVNAAQKEKPQKTAKKPDPTQT